MSITANFQRRFARRWGAVFVILAVALVILPSAKATDNYEYGPDEYVTIANGLSPDGRFAITTHGEGEDGYDNFHVYLTDARTGKTIGPLEEIENILDTGAGSFVAKWSANSDRVLIVWRWSRHDPLLSITYQLKGKRAVPLTTDPVDSDQYAELWRKNRSEDHPTLRRFGTAKKDEAAKD